MTMDARKQRVLQAIVALYGLEGEPVGSSVLANYFDMAVSSATLRNEIIIWIICSPTTSRWTV